MKSVTCITKNDLKAGKLAEKVNDAAWIVLITFLFYALAGFQDDFLKLKGHENKGLSARGKFLRQIIIALLPIALNIERDESNEYIFGYFLKILIGYGSFLLMAKDMYPDDVLLQQRMMERINENDVVHLDEERKAAMVSNLLVVLCGNKDAQPIVNSGSLY